MASTSSSGRSALEGVEVFTAGAGSEETGFPEGNGVTGSVLGVSDGLSDIA